MSELRTKLLELAVQAGATIENATKVADDWECWATEDDPLRLDTPSPAIEEDFYDQLARLDIDSTSIEPEIDWSRPQLVVSESDSEFVVRTTGEHFEDVFTGFSADDGDIPESNYKKRYFKYHGEIPEGHGNKRLVLHVDDGQPIHFNTEDILATDWQIVK